MNDEKVLRLATYNIGDFTGRFEAGSDEGAILLRRALADAKADVYAMQEDVYWYNKNDKIDVRTAVYPDFRNYLRYGTGDYNYKAFASDREIFDFGHVEYTGATYTHPWFLVGSVQFGDITLRLLNLHVEWRDNDQRRMQLEQLADYADSYPYCVVIGDFNPNDYRDGVRLSSNLTYEADLPIFTDRGYTAANAGAFGIFKTIMDSPIEQYPCDNILVSPSLEITNAGRVAADWMNDHALLWADIALK